MTVGLLYTSIGYYFALHRKNFSLRIIVSMFIGSILLQSAEWMFMRISVMRTFVAVSAFLLAIKLPCNFLEKYYKNIRNLSTAIYLEHFLIILIFDFNLQRGTWIDFPFTLLLSVLIFGIVKLIFPEKVNHILFGA